MKFINKYKEPLKIGDYVKVNDDTQKWIESGIYGKVTDTIFKIIEIKYVLELNDYLYLLDIDWFRRHQLEKASDIEIAQMKYNL